MLVLMYLLNLVCYFFVLLIVLTLQWKGIMCSGIDLTQQAED